jgi:hypothetical protein
MIKNFILKATFNHELWLQYLTYEDFEALFNTDKDIKHCFQRFWPQKKTLKLTNESNCYHLDYKCFACGNLCKLKPYQYFDLYFLLCQNKVCKEIALQHSKPNFKCPFMIPKSNLWFVMGEHPLLKFNSCHLKTVKVFLGNYCGLCYRSLDNNKCRHYGSIFLKTENKPTNVTVFPVCGSCINTFDVMDYFKKKSFIFIYHLAKNKCKFFMRDAVLRYDENDDGLIRESMYLSLTFNKDKDEAIGYFDIAYTSTFYYYVEKLQLQLFNGDPIPSTIDFEFMIEPYQPENNFFRKNGITNNNQPFVWYFTLQRSIIATSHYSETYTFNTIESSLIGSIRHKTFSLQYLRSYIVTSLNQQCKYVKYLEKTDEQIEHEYYSQRHREYYGDYVGVNRWYEYIINPNPRYPENPYIYLNEEEMLYAHYESDSDYDSDNEGYLTQENSFGD